MAASSSSSSLSSSSSSFSSPAQVRNGAAPSNRRSNCRSSSSSSSSSISWYCATAPLRPLRPLTDGAAAADVRVRPALSVRRFTVPLPRMKGVRVAGVEGTQAKKVNGTYYGTGIDYNGRELLRRETPTSGSGE